MTQMTSSTIDTTKTTRRQLVRRETFHVLRRGGLIGVEDLVLLAHAEGLSDHEILRLVRSWSIRRWPRR